MIEPQARQRGIQLQFVRLATSHQVLADRIRVKQVLINLLSNAIKYNKLGGSVTVECTPRGPSVIRISVRDTGAGLAPEMLAQLFQPFNRLGRRKARGGHRHWPGGVQAPGRTDGGTLGWTAQ
jgi:signal transduction histidine kinase